MAKFLFLVGEKVIGIANGENKKKALRNLYNKHPKLEKTLLGKTIGVHILVPPDYPKDVMRVVSYLWRDEENHYDEEKWTCKDLGEKCRNHIFTTLKKLRKTTKLLDKA